MKRDYYAKRDAKDVTMEMVKGSDALESDSGMLRRLAESLEPLKDSALQSTSHHADAAHAVA